MEEHKFTILELFGGSGVDSHTLFNLIYKC